MIRLKLASLFLALLVSQARGGFLIRIGDVDGFGYGTAPGFQAAKAGLANRDGAGLLGNGDFLPDINNNGVLAFDARDEFDLRSLSEIEQTAVELGEGVAARSGTRGSEFTDISLSRRYDARSADGSILIGGNPISGLVFGAGGPFPHSPSQQLPNQPGFVFDFDAIKGELNPAASIYFNLVFGDYDVTPAEIQITGADGAKRIVGLRRQADGKDGLIQAATATLDFSDVFQDGGSVWNGFLSVDFVAPEEPYTAFDYVELSTVPEPSSRGLLGIGAALLLAWRLVRWHAHGRHVRRNCAPLHG